MKKICLLSVVLLMPILVYAEIDSSAVSHAQELVAYPSATRKTSYSFEKIDDCLETSTVFTANTSSDSETNSNTNFDTKDDENASSDPANNNDNYNDTQNIQSNSDTSNNDSTNSNVKSPETGVEDYFLVLGIVGAVLITGLYIVNKNNIFKKI